MHSADTDVDLLRVEGDVPSMARPQGLLGPALGSGLGLALGLGILVLYVLLAAVAA